MPWTKPLHNVARVTAAGKIISGRKQPNENMDNDTALSIAGNWRSSHGYPLHVIKTTLKSRATAIDRHALVAKRLKRMPSIISKLQRFHSMQLSTMQDLGGCRAVVGTPAKVDNLVRFYENNPTDASQFVYKKDYIADPKNDGYRSVHLIYEYQGDSQDGAYCGLQVEIQVRSRLQHAWATAVETIDAFTQQALKSGLGHLSWKRFFALMGTAIAMRERRQLVPNTPTDIRELTAELKALSVQLNVPNVFEGLSAGMQITEDLPRGEATAYAIILDSEKKHTFLRAFSSNEAAETEYTDLEKEHLGNNNVQIVLASADSVSALRRAYPSYYNDTSKFIGIVLALIK
jgi:hypothetical protein